MTKRDEEAAVVQWLSTGSLSCLQPLREYANRKLELSIGVWNAVDNDLQRAEDVSDFRQASSSIDSVLSSRRIRVSFGICF